MKKRIFITLCFCLTALLLLAGCGGTTADPTLTPTEEVTPTEESTGILVVADGETLYTLVRSNTSTTKSADVQAAVKLRLAIKDATGCQMTITDDWDKDEAGTAYEILVGKTNRAVTDDIPADLAKNEFFIEVKGHKILIAAVSDLGYEHALSYFLETYLGYSEETGTYARTSLSLPETLTLRQSFEYPAIVYLISDISNLGSSGNKELYNDIVRLIASLQGTLNRTAAADGRYLYYMYDSTDSFWLDYISGDGKLLDGLAQESISNWTSFWDTFGAEITRLGMVVWDPEVAATANVAATVCSAEGYLPVRYSEKAGSLYQWLKEQGVPEKVDLVGKFNGSGTIPDTDIPSSGSAKCDAYLWALELYMDKCSSERICYVLDGATNTETNPMYAKIDSNDPNWNQIYSHDFFIYHRCFFFDLTCTEDEIPCDDPEQPMGTDAATLRKILSTISERNNGKMVKLFGFPPWYAKYTTSHDNGKLAPTTLEWDFVDFISAYNIVKEADAAHPAWMTNASVYCQYQPTVEYKNTESPLEEDFDPKTRYYSIYLGDYDSSAWLKNSVPTFFSDSARGDLPLMWGFNPNLGDRVPMIFDYVYENATENDYFVTSDCGAGYVAPSCLPELDTWTEYNIGYMEKYDMDIVGFIINTTHSITNEIMIAYAEFAPVGSFHNDSSRHLTVLDGQTVYMHLNNGISPTDESTPESMYNYMRGTGDNFSCFRTVVNSPSDIATCVRNFQAYVEEKNDGYTYQYVDPYTLFDLVLQSGQGEQISSK